MVEEAVALRRRDTRPELGWHDGYMPVLVQAGDDMPGEWLVFGSVRKAMTTGVGVATLYVVHTHTHTPVGEGDNQGHLFGCIYHEAHAQSGLPNRCGGKHHSR